MSSTSARHDRLFLIAAGLIVLAGLFYWQVGLTNDPPMYYSGLGQSLYTDPPQYIFHARNYHLFGSSDPFDYPKFDVFKNSLVSRVAYLWFSVAGVSQWSADMVGLLLSLGGLVLILLGLYRYHRPWVLAAVALCYVVNLSLMIHARVPYLENGLIFLAGLLFWLYSWYGDRTWGVIACGVTIALATWLGKLFGVLLLPALLLAIFVSDQPGSWRRVLAAAGSFAGGTVVLIVLMYAGRMSAVSGYFGEQTYGLYGFPPGLTSPLKFVEYLVSYGYVNRLSYRNPDLIGLLALGGALLARMLASKEQRFAKLPPTIMLALFWVVCFVGGLMPLGYSPMRYAVTVVPAVIVLCFALFDQSRSMTGKQSFKFGWLPMAILAFAFWVFLFHLVGNIIFYNTVPPKLRLITWSTLAPAVGLAYMTVWLAGRSRRTLDSRMLTTLIVMVLATVLIINGARTRRALWLQPHDDIRQANTDIAQILGPGAVVSGPYGPTVTQDTRIKSFIHHFGVATVDSTLFDRYPVTHLALDASNGEAAQKAYRPLIGLIPVAQMWVCDNHVQLINISKAFGNQQAHEYAESPYERAATWMNRRQPDSGLATLAPFLAEHPESRAGGLLQGKLQAMAGKLPEARGTYAVLAQRYPDDFACQLECGFFLLQLAMATKDQSLLGTAEQYFYRATVVNPYQADFAMSLWNRTLGQPAASTQNR